MEAFTKLIEALKLVLTWWFFVEPWERAVHIRAGSKCSLRGPGVHFKVPFLDAVYMHNIRERSISPRCQTLSSLDGTVYTLALSISFSVSDPLKLHTSAHDPEPVLQQIVAGAVSQYIATTKAADITPALVSAAASAVDLSRFGVAGVCIDVTSFATTTTLRVIEDGLTPWSNKTLSTTERHC